MIALAARPSDAAVYTEAFRSGLRPDPAVLLSAWSDEHRRLSRKASAEPGRYRTSRTPYVREIMDALTPADPTQDISVMKGTQLGFTELANNWIGYIIDVCPAPVIMALPTVDLAKDHSRQKLDPMLEDTPRLRNKVREHRSRDSGNTTRAKEFPGGILFLIGANSPAGFRSKSIRFEVEDDVDGWPAEVGDEGDPAALIEKRTDTYARRKKILRISTPTTKGVSRIERAYEQSDQRRYNVPCPHCSAAAGEPSGFQVLEWGGKEADFGIKFTRDAAGNVIHAWYICRHCHGTILESAKTWMLEAGVWIAAYPGRAKRGYHLSALYSPVGWVSWVQIAQEFIEAQHNAEKLKVWTNTRLAHTFEQRGEQPDWVMLKARCEPYEVLTVPAGGIILTAATDTHPDRLEVLIKAWGRGEENWGIFHVVIYGDPNQLDVWGQHDALLYRRYRHADGHEMRIVSLGIDAGGHNTQAVYNYCRRRAPIVYALQGANARGKAILSKPNVVDVIWNGEKLPGGCQLWSVGTDTAKDTIYSRLNESKPGPGCYHWPIGFSDEYFSQLTAEKLVTNYNRGGFPVQEWVKVRERNEALDLEVYNYHAMLRATLNGALLSEESLLRPTPPPAGGPAAARAAAPTIGRNTPQRGAQDPRENMRSYERPGYLDR